MSASQLRGAPGRCTTGRQRPSDCRAQPQVCPFSQGLQSGSSCGPMPQMSYLIFRFGGVPVLLLCTTGGLMFTSSFNTSGSRSPPCCVFYFGGLCIKVSKIYAFLSLPCDNDG